jgi:hypothetical protein
MNTATATPTKTLSALDRFVYLPHAPYVVEQMKGLHRAERKRKMGWRM